MPAAAKPNYGTGRRKTAAARVYMKPGSGKITVNDRDVAVYFPSKTHQMILSEPLRVTSTDGTPGDVASYVVFVRGVDVGTGTVTSSMTAEGNKARLRFDPESPIADGRWPYDH